jgi:hypothetical protein
MTQRLEASRDVLCRLLALQTGLIDQTALVAALTSSGDGGLADASARVIASSISIAEVPGSRAFGWPSGSPLHAQLNHDQNSDIIFCLHVNRRRRESTGREVELPLSVFKDSLFNQDPEQAMVARRADDFVAEK